MITIGFKNSSDSWVRAILAVGIGVVTLITCLQDGDPFAILVKVCACFVLGAGIFSLIYGLIKKDEKDFSLMMVNSAVDIVLGIVMFLLAAPIAKIFFYLIGAVLILFGIWQMVVLLSARKYVASSFGFYLLPAIVILLGALLMAPNIGQAIGYICSAGLIIYGIAEICVLYKIRKALKSIEITVVEEPAASVDEQPESQPDDQETI